MMLYAIGVPGQCPRLMTVAIDGAEAALQLRDGEVVVAVEGDPPPPPFAIDGNGAGLVPVARALPDLRRERWIAARVYRDDRQAGGCATHLGRVDSDADSQRKITGAAMMAQLRGAAAAPIDWTMADNSVVAHDGPALIAMALAVADHIEACQRAGTAIRAAIGAADTPEAVAAIDITAGYPA